MLAVVEASNWVPNFFISIVEGWLESV